SKTLDMEYTLVMELMPDDILLMRAGFGWREGTEVKAVINTEMESQTGYTLRSKGPVIVNHLERDSRFRGPPFLIDHDVVSGMSVVIPGSNEPFGILGFYSRRQRSFTEDDSYFLDTIAHILATAVRRDRMEQALRIRTTAMEAAVDAIVVTNRKGVIEYVNPAFCTTTGYASEEVIGQSTSKLRSGKHDHDFYKSLWETILAGETWHGEMINRHKDGSLYPEDMTISPVKDANGQVLRFIAIKRDTTERKRIEHELAEYTTAINLHNLELQDANSSLEEARQNAVRAHTELQSAQQELVRSSRKAGMAEVATGVLHNVGNVLNSVNVSASLVADMIRQSKVTSFGKAVDMMNENLDQLGLFITEDERGKRLPGYFTKLAKLLSDEQAAVLEELKGLVENIEHIKQVIRRQQSYSKQSELTETLEVTDVLEEAIKITTDMLDGLGIELLREYSDVPLLTVDRHRLLEILVNLIGNARHAVKGIDCDGQLTLRTQATEDHQIRIEVADNGIGIPQEDLTRIFAHGFSTKKDGHGFGLHSSALAARQMGGSLSAHSDGSGKGATFTLVLPLEKVEAIP
ncbi:MAG: PAS domain S-box protein, partial [Phycisphaerae bacterium]